MYKFAQIFFFLKLPPIPPKPLVLPADSKAKVSGMNIFLYSVQSTEVIAQNLHMYAQRGNVWTRTNRMYSKIISVDIA